MTLIGSLRQALDRVLLRVVDTPGARVVHEFTGKQLLDSEKQLDCSPSPPIPESFCCFCRTARNCFSSR